MIPHLVRLKLFYLWHNLIDSFPRKRELHVNGYGFTFNRWQYRGRFVKSRWWMTSSVLISGNYQTTYVTITYVLTNNLKEIAISAKYYMHEVFWTFKTYWIVSSFFKVLFFECIGHSEYSLFYTVWSFLLFLLQSNSCTRRDVFHVCKNWLLKALNFTVKNVRYSLFTLLKFSKRPGWSRGQVKQPFILWQCPYSELWII